MRIRRWLLVAVAAAALVVAIRGGQRWRSPRLGPLEVVPAAAHLSVRVGESVRFSARADGAVGFTWLHWGRPVSFEPTWLFVARPEDAGWQQVALEVAGRGGARLSHAWDVGVVAAPAPEIEELTPPAGAMALPLGEQVTFRCRARLPAARPTDRLTFEWMLDGDPVLREEQPAAEGESELTLSPTEPGLRRLRLRVTEDGQTASLADWMIEVAPVEPAREMVHQPEPGVDAEAPPLPAVASVPPTAPPAMPEPPRPRLVRAPGPRRLASDVDRPLVFETRVEPEGASVRYRWTVNGRLLPRQQTGRLEYRPTRPGRHAVAVVVATGRRTLGRDAWVVEVRGPEPVAPAPAATVPPEAVVAREPAVTPEPTTTPPPTVAPEPPPPALAEPDVRRWLDEYARAWSRKDVDALRRMGQVRTGAEAAQLERYFQSIGALEVDVRLVRLTVDGERASVEFERTDTVTDPSGRRQQLRLPPMRKQIERTPGGLRFAAGGGRG